MKNKFSKALAWLFGCLSGMLLLFVAYFVSELQHTKADVRLTRDLVWRIAAERDHALKSDVPQAVQYLQSFDVPADWYGQFQGDLADIIIQARRNAAEDVMDYLRARTGKDFGDDPEKWIEALETEGRGEVK